MTDEPLHMSKRRLLMELRRAVGMRKSVLVLRALETRMKALPPGTQMTEEQFMALVEEEIDRVLE